MDPDSRALYESLFPELDQGMVEGGDPVIWFRLSAYELVNLCAALWATMDSDSNALGALHTGDWTACVARRLRENIERLGIKHPPNRTPEQMKDDARSMCRYVVERLGK